MLPRSSRPLSRKLQCTSFDNIRAAETTLPLLFLYPRWFHNPSAHAAQHAPLPASTPTYATVPAPKDPLQTLEETRVPEGRSVSPQTEQNASADLFSDPGASEASEGKTSSRLTDDSKQLSANAPAVSSRLNTVDQIVTGINKTLRQRYGRLPRSKFQARSELEKALLDRSREAPSYTNARKEIETMFQEIYAGESENERARLDWLKEKYRRDRIDWLPQAQKLAALNPPEIDHSRDREIYLKADFLRDYAGALESNMWIHRVGSGTEVHLLPISQSHDGRRPLLLRGSPRSVELAHNDLLRLQKKFSLTGRTQKKDDMQLRSVVSVMSFISLVGRLVTHQLPIQAQQETGETTNERKAAALLRLFLDPAASKHASTYALSRALNFVTQHDEIEATADMLYEQAQKLGLKPDIACFNKLLRQAITRNRQAKVNSLIDDMYHAGVKADGTTWLVLFKYATHTRSARSAILSMIKDASVVLSRNERRWFARKVAETEIFKMADSAYDFKEMLDTLDKLFGPGWLTVHTYERMIKSATDRRSTKIKELSKALLEVAQERDLGQSQRLKHAKLVLHRHEQDVEAALGSVFSMLAAEENGDIMRPAIAYAFMTAWENRWANVCRVLWRHAASHGNIFNTMQTVVYRSLLRNSYKKDNKHQTIWKRTAGSLVAGTDLDTRGFDQTFPRLSQRFLDEPNPMVWLSTFVLDDGIRDEQISLAYLIMNRDLTAWKRYQPMTNNELSGLLEQARKKDLLSQDDNYQDRLPLPSLLLQMIPVPLKMLESSSEPDLTSPRTYPSSKRFRFEELKPESFFGNRATQNVLENLEDLLESGLSEEE